MKSQLNFRQDRETRLISFKANVSLDMAIKIARGLGYPKEAFVEVYLNDLLRKSGINKVIHLKSKAA